MKYALVTRADDSVKQMSNITHPIMKDFADRWECDFIILNHKTDYIVPSTPHQCYKDGITHYRIMKLYDLLNKYDRILSMDTDMVILPNCPNPFEEVPEHKIGSVLEDKGSREMDRVNIMLQIQSKYGMVGWTSGYINTGFFIVSKQHKDIFQKINGEYWTSIGVDDIHIGYLIHKLGFEVHELSYKWNHMSMFSEEWNGSPDRFESYVIHYAGAGVYNPGVRSKEEQALEDLNVIYCG
jgi:lipopolysaccharide biosynthesis glycosyltransferase